MPRTYFNLANDIIDAIIAGDSETLMVAANEAYDAGLLIIADIAREAFDVATGAACIDSADEENAILCERIGFAIESFYANF